MRVRHLPLADRSQESVERGQPLPTPARHEVRRVTYAFSPSAWVCSCGSTFRNEDDADLHAANAREESK
jgi:hypothetical protein